MKSIRAMRIDLCIRTRGSGEAIQIWVHIASLSGACLDVETAPCKPSFTLICLNGFTDPDCKEMWEKKEKKSKATGKKIIFYSFFPESFTLKHLKPFVTRNILTGNYSLMTCVCTFIISTEDVLLFTVCLFVGWPVGRIT